MKDNKILIKNVIEHKESLENHIERLYEVFGRSENNFVDNIWILFDSYVESVETILEDNFHCLSWYIWDNNGGKDKKEWIIDSEKYKIKTINDLVNVIKKLNS